jgi:hypothetical protein
LKDKRKRQPGSLFVPLLLVRFNGEKKLKRVLTYLEGLKKEIFILWLSVSMIRKVINL